MLQNIPSEPATDGNITDNQIENLLFLPSSGARYLKSLANDILPPCYMNKKDSSTMTISHLASVKYKDALSKSMLKHFMWCIFRLHCSTVSQHVPWWAGFISETGPVPKRLITKDYYPIINYPVTDYSTIHVQEYQTMRRERSVRNTLSQHLA